MSPLRTEARNKNSFVVYEDFFYDHGSSTGGDVIDLCALLAHGGDRRAAIYDLAKITGTAPQPSNDWVQQTQKLNNQIQRWHENLTPEIRDYLHSRGINDDTITALKIGYTGDRVVIPYWKNGYIYSYCARATKPDQLPKYLKRKNDEISDFSAPWGMQTLARTDKPLIIAEGAFDALSFYQDGYPIFATMGGHFSKDQLKTVLSAVNNYSQVYLTFDADGAGAEFTINLAKTLFSHRAKFSVAEIPRPHKDISDYYAAGGNLSALLESARDGITVLCQSITDEAEFKTFAYQAARYIDAPELAKLFKTARQTDNFPSEWLSALQKTCEKPPSEDSIARKVTEAHQLKFRPAIGFYEYIRGVWQPTDKTKIQSYIGAELGRYRTGARLSSIIKIIETDTLTEQPFDKNPVFNFINGTLELSDNPVFREPRPDDLCSIQSKYPYEPSARSAEWEKFVMDISGDDEKRAELLQEIAGYVLFPDNSLERLFVLQGSGGNGKSVYLNILQSVYGIENTSSVSVAGLCADFQRIYLSTSLLNIAAEIKSNMSGSEEYLKDIASGGTISACYKGKDYVQFRPRCKMIFATNGQLRSQDTSEGLQRRLTIVNFTQSFVDYPKKPNEKQRDTTLQAKLENNLPAIFNWCLDGYKMLIATRTFTEMEDEAQAKVDLAEASNPLITFLKDNHFTGRVTRDEMYRRYHDWCEESGHKQANRNTMMRGIRQLLDGSVPEIETKIDGVRSRVFVFPDDENTEADELL